MKKTHILLFSLGFLFLSSSLYSHFILQNSWIFIFLFRIIFPLIITFAIFFSHKIYHSQQNIANLLVGRLLIIPGGFVSLYFLIGLQLPGLGIVLPFSISIVLVIILDMLIRWILSKITSKPKRCALMFKEIKNQWIYYGILALMYSLTIASLTVIF